MNFSMIWPIILIVISNIVYNVCSKETPSTINPFAALTITYLVGSIFSAVMYYLLNRDGHLLQEYQKLNWSSFVLGLSLVGLEAGSIYMYKAGWNISSGQIVHSILLALCLIVVGVLAYHETIGFSKMVGIIFCMIGLYLINR